MFKIKKYLHIKEYVKLDGVLLPEKKNSEHKFEISKNHFIYTSVKTADSVQEIKESFENTLFANKVEELILPLDSVVIYDNLDIDKDQELAYVFECPICSNIIITSNKDLVFCSRCENKQFPFKLIALINIDQMEDIAINNDDISKLVVIKDGTIRFIDEPKGDN